MKTSLKKLAVAAGCGACLVQAAVVPAAAETIEPQDYLWEEFAPAGTGTVEDTVTPRARGDIMNRGYIKLSNVNGKAAIYGETLGIAQPDEIGLELYLEQYSGTTFNSYDDWSYVRYNSSTVEASLTVSVPKGYYYRLRGYHYVKDGGMFEAGSTMTDGLPIR